MTQKFHPWGQSTYLKPDGSIYKAGYTEFNRPPKMEIIEVKKTDTIFKEEHDLFL
jgi:hypothetical protein